MLQPLGHCDAPDATLRNELARFRAGDAQERAFSFTFDLSRYWLDHQSIRLGVACELRREGSDARPGAASITSRIALSDQAAALAALAAAPGSLDRFCEQFALTPILLPGPLPLQTHREPKPWGEEVWYTGIERRGVCTVAGVPLPWLLALGHELLFPGVRRELLLLKILAPHAREVDGDLYFEMHREKVEVYVITGVDPHAWPSGRGRIRLGFAPERLARAPDRARFAADYLAAVHSYRELRVAIDAQLDRMRAAEGIATEAVVPPATRARWLDAIDPAMRAEEAARRAAMEAFYGVRELQVGDVVQVTPGIPHSLQHGVRAVEFQTPHYERLILSFGQKVLTQTHWDTEEALVEAVLAPPPAPSLPVRVDEAGVRVVQAARFASFEVLRITLAAGARYVPAIADYGLVIGIRGRCVVAGLELGGEDACLVTAAVPDGGLGNATREEAVCLLAVPLVAS